MDRMCPEYQVEDPRHNEWHVFVDKAIAINRTLVSSLTYNDKQYE